jgi:hypothetical protein
MANHINVEHPASAFAAPVEEPAVATKTTKARKNQHNLKPGIHRNKTYQETVMN